MPGESNLFISSRSLGQVQQPNAAPALASQRSPRFLYWFAFFLFSLIVANASIEASDRVHSSSQGIVNQKWAVIGSVISLGVAVGVVLMHISPAMTIFLVSTKLEGVICIIMMALWSSLVAVISDSSSGLAVDGEGSVAYGNLYYCSWGGFVCAILLFLNYLKEVYFINVNEELSLRSDRLTLWIGYLIVSIVLTAAASNIFDHECLGSDRFGTKFCNRTLLALVDGATGCACAIVIIGMKLSTGLAPWGVELLVAVFLLICNAFSMGLVTCEVGPGAKIGNLFYFSWLSVIFPFMLVSSTFEYISQRNQDEKGVVDAYVQPRTEPGTFMTTKNVSDYYEPDARTEEYSAAGTDPWAYDETSRPTGYDGKSSKSVYSEVDSRRQSYYSQGASTYATEVQASEYGDDQSTGGLYVSDMDPTNFKKPGQGGGQSYASGMDPTNFKKPEQGGGQSYARGLDRGYSYASDMDASVQKSGQGGGQSYAGGNSYASGMDPTNFKKPGQGGGQSYASDMDEGYSYASDMDASVQKPGQGGGQS